MSQKAECYLIASPDVLVEAVVPIALSMSHAEHPESLPRLHVGTNVI